MRPALSLSKGLKFEVKPDTRNPELEIRNLRSVALSAQPAKSTKADLIGIKRIQGIKRDETDRTTILGLVFRFYPSLSSLSSLKEIVHFYSDTMLMQNQGGQGLTGIKGIQGIKQVETERTTIPRLVFRFYPSLSSPSSLKKNSFIL